MAKSEEKAMILEKDVMECLKDFVENVVDSKKEDNALFEFENHIDEEIKKKINNMDIDKTSKEIAKRALANVEELEKKGFFLDGCE